MGGIRAQPERDKVLKPCLNRCDWLLRNNRITQYRRLDAMDVHHIPGAPDIEIFFIHDNTLHLLFAECKRPDGGSLRHTQKTYQNKFQGLKNVTYLVIRSPSEIDAHINRVTGYTEQLFKEMDAIFE